MTNDREAMTLERQAFEEWYTTHAHDYERSPVGSRDCGLQWAAWQAAIANLSRAAEPVGVADLSRLAREHPTALYSPHHPDASMLTKLYIRPPGPAREAKDAAWKDIGDGYEVSCTGRVRHGSRELIPYAKAKGYVAVSLWRGGERREEYVHRLVAGVFCDRVSSLQTQVNHRDGDKTNNYASNLEWCTPQENRIHAARVLFTDTRQVIGTCIATGEEVLFRSLAEAEEHGFIRANIQKCIAGKRKKHGGYTWRDAAMAQESGDAT